MSKSVELFGAVNKRRSIELLKRVMPLRRRPEQYFNSSIIIPLCYYDGEPSILYTKRAMTLRTYAGEVSFPGGRVDAGESPTTTALRELSEEVGIPHDYVDIWTPFVACPTRSTDNFVTPVVGFCGYFDSRSHTLSPDAQRTREITPQLSANEVDFILFRSIDWLSRPENLNYTFLCNPQVFPFTDVTSFEGKPPGIHGDRIRESFHYAMPIFGGFPDLPRLWGLTALLTYQLLFCLLPQGIPSHPMLPNPFAKHF